jgi:5-methylthioadenosine/S-adenosylhomocysteine deaminase
MIALKKRSSKVSHNPVSNMYLANGVAPIPRMLELGIPVGLGVDGATSNNNQDMIEAMKTTALLHKVSSLNPEIISCEKILEMATINGAKALQKEKELGSIEPSKKADIIILDLKKPNTTPSIYAPSTIVYCANGSNVSTTIIDGKVVMEDRKVKTLNEGEVMFSAQRAIEELLERSKHESDRSWKTF